MEATINGSSFTRDCINSTSENGTSTCRDPQVNSILFDGNVPCLCGRRWANQLLTLTTSATHVDITFDFSAVQNYVGVERIEIAFFNCPLWGIGVSNIIVISTSESETLATVNTQGIVSCDSLIIACTEEISTTKQSFTLRFVLTQGSIWLYLAEITFYSLSRQYCQSSIVSFVPIATGDNLTGTQAVFTATTSSSTSINSSSPYTKKSDSINIELSSMIGQLTTTMSLPQCSLLPDAIVIVLASLLSSLLTLALSVPLTALVTYRVCSTRFSIHARQDFHEKEKNVHELKDQAEREEELMNQSYATVNTMATSQIEVTKNEAYAVLNVY